MKYLLFIFCAALSAYTPKNYDHLLKMDGFNKQLIALHLKLYEGYVQNTNDLLGKLKGMSPSYEYGALKRRLGWEFDGMRLHELYFDQLGGDGKANDKGALYAALVAQFGSFEQWKKDFIATGSIRGIGWAILYRDPQSSQLINTWINEHDTGHLATASPILIMDVFEHAYLTQWGLNRAGYITAFLANLDWKVIDSRFTSSSVQ